MSAKINPLAEWVVAQPVAQEAKTASGLYLTESAKEKPVAAKVISVGKDVKSVKAGDKILYKEYSTTEVKLDRDEFILLKEEDILATLK
ncbi:MAG TPA: co-chaperone GroES [Candidatus Saccharimonadales bacterium]|jgi:chaperonin GroES